MIHIEFQDEDGGQVIAFAETEEEAVRIACGALKCNSGPLSRAPCKLFSVLAARVDDAYGGEAGVVMY